MNYKQILFLDFDGVINSEEYAIARYQTEKREYLIPGPDVHPDFDPYKIGLIDELLDSLPELRVCISSSWRIGAEIEEIKSYFPKSLIASRIIGKTPYISGVQRGYEIQEWIKENPVQKFAVLDDDNDMDDVRANFVRTSWKTGVSYENIKEVKRLLSFDEAQ